MGFQSGGSRGSKLETSDGGEGAIEICTFPEMFGAGVRTECDTGA